MFCHNLFVMTCIISYIYLKSGDIQASPLKKESIAKLKNFCPHSRFCDQEQEITKPTVKSTNHDNSVMPCCSSCSCSKECGRKRNCCTYENDRYKLDQTLGTICRQLQPYPQSDYYHVVDKCLDRSEICRFVNNTRNEYFRPVYSNKTGMVYFNKECARCHHQTITTSFRSIVTCAHVVMSYFSMVQGIKSGQTNDECALNFIKPNAIDLSTELCHPFKIKYCDARANYSVETENLCRSFNATFYATRFTYNNVFCFLCNTVDSELSSDWTKKYEYCPVKGREKLSNNIIISLLLDSSLDVTRGSENDNSVSKLPQICTQRGKRTLCRPLLCPEGQDYLDGSCKQLATKWYFKRLRMIVKLTSKADKADIFGFDLCHNESHNGMKESSIVLERPGFEDWNYSMFCNIVTVDTTSSYFVVILTFRYKNIVPKRFIGDIKTSLAKPWKLYYNKSMITLKPTFNEFVVYKQLSIENKTQMIPGWYGIEPSFANSLERNKTYYVIKFLLGDELILHQKQRKGTLFLTKLFFCNLVELERDEYILGIFTIYIIHSGKILGDGEYTVVIDERVRICAYDMESMGSSNLGLAQTANPRIALYMVGCVIIFILPPHD